jgi:hypothetical protein
VIALDSKPRVAPSRQLLFLCRRLALRRLALRRLALRRLDLRRLALGRLF